MRILIHTEANPNLIDGSSVWLASLAEMLATHPGVEPTVLLSAEVRRHEVVGHLMRHPGVRMIQPGELTGLGFLDRLRLVAGRKLAPGRAADAIQAMDAAEPFDWFLLRGPAILSRFAARPGLAKRSWAYLADPRSYQDNREGLRKVSGTFSGMLCQTGEARSFTADLLGEGTAGRIALLPPMVQPFEPRERPSPGAEAPGLGYAGKLSPPYRILEMLTAFRRIRERFPAAEFHVIGDKFHNAPRVEGFEEKVRKALGSVPGVVWHGGLSRGATLDILSRVDVASSWRDASFDDSLELSTKVLEYGSLGLPVLMNPARVQRRVFGPDYPAFVRTGDEFVTVFSALIERPELYRAASQRTQARAAAFSYPVVCQELLSEFRASGQTVSECPRDEQE
jgi:glycosyltransferase involved in cell wall biosynthesis